MVWFAKRDQIVEICWSAVLGFLYVVEVYPVVGCVASGDDASLVSDCYGFALAGCCVTNSGSKIEWDAQRVDDECLDFGVAVQESGSAILEADTIWCAGMNGVRGLNDKGDISGRVVRGAWLGADSAADEFGESFS